VTTEWIGGRRPVAEALASGRPVVRLLVASGLRSTPELEAILARARAAGIPQQTQSHERLSKLGGFDGHQGLLLEVEPRRWADLAEMSAAALRAGRPPLVLVLENLQDPTNFGTLLRAAEAAGVDGVIFPERASAPLTASAVKTSAGASEHLRLARVPILIEALLTLKTDGLRLVAADQDAEVLAWDADLTGPLALVVGGEGSGVSGALRRRCDLLVRLPMAGQVASLNAATAGAVMLFEVLRQRRAAGESKVGG
jgi:23S rRNA (guanosine2251-2'-O)-methyltransferase